MIANGWSAQYRQSSAAGATRAGIHIIDVRRIDDNIAR
jgi:hypothetical protein